VTRVGDESPLALHRRLHAVEQRVQRRAERADLVARRRNRQSLRQVARRDVGGARAHALDRPERGASDEVTDERCEQQRDGTAEEQLLPQVGERLVAGAERCADHDDQPLPLCLDRRGEQSDCVGADVRALHEDGPAPRAAELRLREHRLASQRRRGVEDPAARVEHLRQAAVRRRRVPEVGLLDERGDVRGACVEPLVDGAVERRRETMLERESRSGEDDGERDGEDERQANAERNPAHAAASPRSR
jgi:hypothetical protein